MRKLTNHIEIWLLWNPFLAPTDCELACKIIVALSTFLFDFITTLNLCILHNYEETSESCQILYNDITINHVKAYEWIRSKFMFTQVAITRKLSNYIEIWLLWNPFSRSNRLWTWLKIYCCIFQIPFRFSCPHWMWMLTIQLFEKVKSHFPNACWYWLWMLNVYPFSCFIWHISFIISRGLSNYVDCECWQYNFLKKYIPKLNSGIMSNSWNLRCHEPCVCLTLN